MDDTREDVFGDAFHQPLLFRKTKTIFTESLNDVRCVHLGSFREVFFPAMLLCRCFSGDAFLAMLFWRCFSGDAFPAMLFRRCFSFNLSYLGDSRLFTECLNDDDNELIHI